MTNLKTHLMMRISKGQAIINDVDKHLQFKASTNTTLNEGIWKQAIKHVISKDRNGH
jgi:hypothetical protein